MISTRRLALVALCMLMPFLMVEEASATFASPTTLLRLSVSIEIKPFTGSLCKSKAAWVYQPQPIPLYSGDPALMVSYQIAPCSNDTRVVEYLVASAYYNSTAKRTEVAVVGVASLQKLVSGAWKEQYGTEVGKILKLTDSTSGSWILTSGTGRGTITYKMSTGDY
jgi:hypothetical protein